MPELGTQIVWLFVLAIPIACMSWTVTHEDIFAEFRGFFERTGERSRSLVVQKFCKLFLCEYCFSHYVTAFVLALSGFQLLIAGWRGFLLGGFALVWIANQYMGLYFRLRLGIKVEGVEIKVKEQVLQGIGNGEQGTEGDHHV